MNKFSNADGQEVITLTKGELDELLEDAYDSALADQARSDATLPLELVQKLLNDEMHPLAAWREAKGLTQAQLAQEIGVRVATIGDWERGASDPKLSTAVKAAKVLGVDVDSLVK